MTDKLLAGRRGDVMNEDNEPNGSLGPEIIDTRDEKIGHISPHLTSSPPLLRVWWCYSIRGRGHTPSPRLVVSNFDIYLQ